MMLAMRLKAKGMSDDELIELLDVTPETFKSVLNTDKYEND